MTQPPDDLDEAAKARIEAEERYRAQMRAKAEQEAREAAAGDWANRTPRNQAEAQQRYAVLSQNPPTRRPPSTAKTVWIIVGAVALALVLAWAVTTFTPSLSSFSSSPPQSAKLTIYQTDNNMGVNAYFELQGYDGSDVSSAGTAHLRLTKTVYDASAQNSEVDVLNQDFPITRDCFQKTTIGLGAFAHPGTVCVLGQFSPDGVKQSDSGEAYLTFTTSDGQKISAKDGVVYP